ncbi:DUF3592 domain-containing protein [Chondrinema litorale]|uniref:DUF3592 domain-containing protein n=1 Tax=Chondrinema litorale TaxID=2994555 RepID=UPI0025436682|nr:DUF3592 domain-containing protein [Chondrinema litorale]UZR92790.1 hypothetical protein OQ292_13095 [Chondrinema litorale]
MGIVISIIIVLLAVAVYLYLVSKNKQKIQNAVETTGEIMGFEEINQPSVKSLVIPGENSENEKFYPIIRFRVQGAQMVRFRAQTGYNKPLPFKEGDTVNIEYEAENPLIARIKD